MASVFYFIQSKKDNANIYLNFAPDGSKRIKRKTQESINPIFWNAEPQRKGFPKNIHSGSKELIKDIQQLREKLTSLESFVYKEYNNRKTDQLIDGEWLTNVIAKYYNDGKEIKDLEYLLKFLPHYEKNILPFRSHRGRRISHRTVQKHSTVVKYLIEFITLENPKLKVYQYDKSYSNKFEQYLRTVKLLSDNTVGRYLKHTKTIIKEAKNENIAVHPQLEDIKGFTVETPTVILELHELQKIQDLKIVSDYLETSRDWLIIGCYTGQRAGDLFKMNSKMIMNIDGNDFINLTQSKTGVTVPIPLHKEVRKILDKRNGDFPPLFSSNSESNKTRFNKALKLIARQANINRIEKGRKYFKESKSAKGYYIHGEYPLYEIISSHVCRRTFASMYYGKIPNQILMSVTGHRTEKEFLKYIGVESSELSKQMFKYWDALNNTDHQEAPKKSQNAR